MVLCNMLPDKVVSVSRVSSIKRHLDGFWTGIYIIIAKPKCSTGSHNVIIVLVKFLLSTIDMFDGNRGR